MDQVTRGHVEGWVAEPGRSGPESSTCDVRLKALSQFVKYVCEEENKVNPVDRVARVKMDDPVIHIPTDDDSRAVLALGTRRLSLCGRLDQDSMDVEGWG